MQDLNLNKIKSELAKLTDVELLKKELHRISNEVRNYDVQANLSPKAKSRIKSLEKRFTDVLKKVTVVQKQVDVEINKIVHTLRVAKTEAEKKLKSVSIGKSTSKKSAKKTTKKAGVRKATKKTTTKKSV